MKPHQKVSISAKSKALLSQLAVSNQLSGVVPRPDGRYDIWLSDENLRRLQKIDADIDIAIERLAHRAQGGGIQ